KSESTGSLKAEICPWEAPELESTHKAAICPWEAAAPPSSKEKSSQDKDAPSTSTDLSKKIGDSTSGKEEKASRDRESICPWESLSTEQPPEKPRTGSPVLPKTPLKKSQSGESLKAEICPWELESPDKTEICPWEVAASLPEKGAAPGKESLPPRKSGVSKPPEKG
ncbi:GP179 protein, partial [Trogon melanurus]|nr:GP179 protein [Trogon melanurus]